MDDPQIVELPPTPGSYQVKYEAGSNSFVDELLNFYLCIHPSGSLHAWPVSAFSNEPTPPHYAAYWGASVIYAAGKWSRIERISSSA